MALRSLYQLKAVHQGLNVDPSRVEDSSAKDYSQRCFSEAVSLFHANRSVITWLFVIVVMKDKGSCKLTEVQVVCACDLGAQVS